MRVENPKYISINKESLYEVIQANLALSVYSSEICFPKKSIVSLELFRKREFPPETTQFLAKST